MPPNPLRASSVAGTSVTPAADPFATTGTGDVPTLHFDARVQPAGADEPAAEEEPASPILGGDESALPLSSQAGGAAPTPTAPSAAVEPPAVEFTLPPYAAAADVELPPAEPAVVREPPNSYPPVAEYSDASPAESVAALPVSPPDVPEVSVPVAGYEMSADVDRRLAPATPERGPYDSNAPRGAGGSSYLPAAFSKLDGLSTAGAGLAIVVGLFLVCMWMVRRTGPKPTGVLPSEAFAVLGRAPLNAGAFAQLLRVGNKLVLVAVSSDGAQPLTEVTDPDEVDRLTGLCRGSRPGGHSAEFQQVLAQLSREPARGFLGREGSTARRRAA
jgi:flagellar biogenesis protein FliO